MYTWRFLQGIRDEWLWYRMDETGSVIATADRGFEELSACMANAEAAGFDRQNYHVHTRTHFSSGPVDVHSACQPGAAQPSGGGQA